MRAAGRCTLVSSIGGLLVPACVATPGTIGAGLPCARDAAGIDACLPGHACLAGAGGDVCTPLCSTASECAVGETCAVASTVATDGICARRCVPYDGSCPVGTGCRTIVVRGRGGVPQVATACVPGGSGGADAPCRGFEGCLPEHFCATETAGATCQPLCDAGHPCSGARTCWPPNGSAVPIDPAISACLL